VSQLADLDLLRSAVACVSSAQCGCPPVMQRSSRQRLRGRHIERLGRAVRLRLGFAQGFGEHADSHLGGRERALLVLAHIRSWTPRCCFGVHAPRRGSCCLS
jgi:hypothetical protein